MNETDSTPYLAAFQTSSLTFNVKTYIPQLKKPLQSESKNVSMKSVFSNNHKIEDCFIQCLAAKAKGMLAIVSTFSFFLARAFIPKGSYILYYSTTLDL